MYDDALVWQPMLISAAIIIPLLLILARMSSTVAKRLVDMDAKSVEMAKNRRKGRTTRKQLEADAEAREARWNDIRNYRRTSAMLVIFALVAAVTYGNMAAAMLLPQWAILLVMALTIALLALAAWWLLRWAKVPTPSTEVTDGDSD